MAKKTYEQLDVDMPIGDFIEVLKKLEEKYPKGYLSLGTVSDYYNKYPVLYFEYGRE